MGTIAGLPVDEILTSATAVLDRYIVMRKGSDTDGFGAKNKLQQPEQYLSQCSTQKAQAACLIDSRPCALPAGRN